LGGKWLDLLKEVAPNVTHAAIMFNPDTAPAMCYLEGKSQQREAGMMYRQRTTGRFSTS
jgi:hypothetical protein